MESIGDAQGFSGKTPITPSGGFSVEALKGVTPSWKMLWQPLDTMPNDLTNE